MSFQLVFRFTLASCLLFLGVHAVWPRPTSSSFGSGYLPLSKIFAIVFDGGNPPADLADAISRALHELRNDQHQVLQPKEDTINLLYLSRANDLSSLKLILSPDSNTKRHGGISAETTQPLAERDESYQLKVPDTGEEAILVAKSYLGLFRGLTTFTQLVYSTEGTRYIREAPVCIHDSPAFRWRGLLLDTARNFYPKGDIKRTIDALAWAKLNVFHWHIVDSQSFPLQVDDFPELIMNGAYGSESVYTTEDVQEIVNYAGQRGVDVMMEIDTPGHTAILFDSHPGLVACAYKMPWSTYAAEPPAGQIRIASQEATSFIARLFASILKTLPGRYFSSGGDEVNLRCYLDDEETQDSLRSSGQTIDQALQNFVDVTHQEIINADKSPVVWHEMALNHGITLNDNAIVLVWKGAERAAAVAAKGLRLIHVPSEYFYLDCGGGGWLGRNLEGNSWCDPYKTWQRIYSFDPFAGIKEIERHLVLGGEVALWSEQSDAHNLDQMLWPRAAALAEVFWTGNPSRSAAEALPRLHDFRYRLVRRGIKAVPLQPHWCALRPGACDLETQMEDDLGESDPQQVFNEPLNDREEL